MDEKRRRRLIALAQTLASSGGYANWRAVQTRLRQLGHHEVDALFDAAFCAEIDAICARNGEGRS
jgi:hypothetical protein